LKNGHGRVKLSNGELFVGEFMDDVAHGDGKFYCMSGEVRHGKWMNGIMVKEYS